MKAGLSPSTSLGRLSKSDWTVSLDVEEPTCFSSWLSSPTIWRIRDLGGVGEVKSGGISGEMESFADGAAIV